MKSANLSKAGALLFGACVLGQNLNKPVLFNDGLSPHVDSVFFEYLEPTQSTNDQWGWGWIPEACLSVVQGTSFSPYDIDVYNVHYDDCSTAFVICRHNQAQMSLVQMIDAFGRTPIHDRQWTQHILALPADSCSAETGGAVSTFYGACYIPSVFVHELTHTLDAYVNDQNPGDDGNVHVFSGTSPYQTAISEDSCVTDSYANTDDAEDFAQTSVLAIFEKVNPGGLDPIGNWRCLVNQKNSVDSTVGDELTPGGTCTRRWADSTIECMGPAAGCTSSKRSSEKSAAPRPKPANKKGDPLVSDKHPMPGYTGPPSIRHYGNLPINHTASAQAEARINAWAGKDVRA